MQAPMPAHEETYRGKRIVVTPVGDAHRVRVDDEDIPVERHPTSGKYWTPRLAYVQFSSPHELARAVVDHQSA